MFKIVLVMFLWSICFPLITIGLPYAPHMTFAAMRALLAGVILLIPAFIMKRPQPKGGKTWLYLLMIGLGSTTLGLWGMFHASMFVLPGMATVISNTQPLMAAVLAAIILREHLNKWGKLGLLMGFLGIVVIALPSLLLDPKNGYLVGLLWIILAALGVTVSNVLIRKIANKVDALSAMGWQLIIGSVFLALMAISSEDVTKINWNINFVLSWVGLALPGTAIAYWLWCDVLKTEELNRANAFSFLVPVFGLIMGVMFFNEKFNTTSSIGIIFILMGIILVNTSKKVSNKSR